MGVSKRLRRSLSKRSSRSVNRKNVKSRQKKKLNGGAEIDEQFYSVSDLVNNIEKLPYFYNNLTSQEKIELNIKVFNYNKYYIRKSSQPCDTGNTCYVFSIREGPIVRKILLTYNIRNKTYNINTNDHFTSNFNDIIDTINNHILPTPLT